jgi:hypothetical protein
MGFLFQDQGWLPRAEIPMDEKILAIYSRCADFWQALDHAEEPYNRE